MEKERYLRLTMDNLELKLGESLFLKALDIRFGYKTLPSEIIISAWKFMQKINFKPFETPSRVFLNHPLRVATILLRNLNFVNEEIITIALLHNVLETTEIKKEQLIEYFGKSIATAVQILTIDRSRENKEYFIKYYSDIEKTSKGCSAVKVADKLDNIYMICFNPSERIRNRYLDEIDTWVIPLASRIEPELEMRLKVASHVMRKIGFLDKDNEIEKALKEYKYE